jgi:hypothetical protein
MASGASDSEGRFIEAGHSFPGILLGSQAFFLAPEHSSWLLSVLGAEMDDAREGSWSRCCEALALLGH